MLTRNLGTDRGIEAVQALLGEGLAFLNDVTDWVSAEQDAETAESCENASADA